MSKATKITLVVAALIVLVGSIIFAVAMMNLKWDFKKITTTNYQTNEYQITESFNDISIQTDTADVSFVCTEDTNAKVVCYERENERHLTSVKDGVLTIEPADEKKWYEYIGINFDSPKITVYIPKGEYGAISVKGSTSGIDINGLSVSSLDLSVSTGKVSVSNLNCAGTVKIGVSTGKTVIDTLNCKSLISSASTGDVTLKDTIAAEKFFVETSTGDVRLDKSDANEIFIKTDTGDVSGTLLTQKVFITDSATGKIKVPDSVSGGRCEITTDTGDIKISVS